jgi:hypothetical protein
MPKGEVDTSELALEVLRAGKANTFLLHSEGELSNSSRKNLACTEDRRK